MGASGRRQAAKLREYGSNRERLLCYANQGQQDPLGLPHQALAARKDAGRKAHADVGWQMGVEASAGENAHHR